MEVRCRDAGMGFSVLAFDTLGAAHPTTVSFLRGIFRDAKSKQICPDVAFSQKAWNRVVVPFQVDIARPWTIAQDFFPSFSLMSGLHFLLCHLHPTQFP